MNPQVSAYDFEKALLLKNKLFPQEVHVDITNLCHFNCVFCEYYGALRVSPPGKDPDWGNQHLNFNVFRQLTEDLAEMRVPDMLLVAAGDPFMHPRIMEMIELVKSHGLRLQIFTAFAALNEKRVRRIFELKLDTLIVSLHAGTADGYVRIHPNQTEKTFSMVRDRLLLLKHLKKQSGSKTPRLFVRMVPCEANYLDIEALARLASEIAADEVEYGPLFLYEEIRSLALDRDRIESIKAALPRAKAILEAHGIRNNVDLYEELLGNEAAEGKYTVKFYQYHPCYIGWQYSRIKVNGDVVACCGANENPLGNICTHRFRNIWTSYAYHTFRQEMKSGEIYKKYQCYACPHVVNNLRYHQRFIEEKNPEIQLLVLGRQGKPNGDSIVA